MAIGMSTACFFGRLLTEEAVEQMAKMGVPNIEVFLGTYSEYKRPFIEKLCRITQKNNMRVLSVHDLSMQFEPQLFSDNIRARKDAVALYRQVIRGAERLGAQNLVFHGPANNIRARKLRIDFKGTGEITSELAEYAKAHGVRLTWETVHWCWYGRPGFAADLLPHVASDNLYFTLDVKQAAQSGYPVEEYIDNMAGRLVNVHVCDYAHTEEGVVPIAPFQGECDFVRLRQKLKEAGYKGNYVLEIYRQNFRDYEELLNIYRAVCDFFAD